MLRLPTQAVLDVDTATPAPAPEVMSDGHVDGLPKITPGSIPAKVLHRAWEGDPAIVVASPPGAGKSTLLVACASHLASRARLTIAVATQTNAQSVDLANRFAESAPSTPVYIVAAKKALRPKHLAESIRWVDSIEKVTTKAVVISSSAKWIYSAKSEWSCDVLMVDEAWQLPWYRFGAIASIAPQFILVGDPGQIDPVVTGDQTRWDGWRSSPIRPAPAVMLDRHEDKVTRFNLPNTYRCGPDTAKVLQPLYSFPFGSKRWPRSLLLDGGQMPEIATVAVPGTGNTADPAIAKAIADHVRNLIGNGTLRGPDGDHPVTGSDVGVVVAHRTQLNAVAALLADVDGVLIDTADSFQGGERHVMIAWLPIAGKRTLSDFDLDTGRLCVMLSRHTTHCLVVERDDTRRRLEGQRDLIDPKVYEMYTSVLNGLPRVEPLEV
jgi:hypothetical protein